MKTIKKTSQLLFLLIFTLLSCNKDDDETPALAPEQNPLSGYLTASGFNQVTTNFVNSLDYEFGISFIPLVNGKMTAIVVKIPDVRTGLRVTVWDKLAGTVLRSELVDVPTAGVEVTKPITALDLIKDKEYFITFNSNDWYNHKKTDNSNVTYPFTVDDIKITSYGFVDGVTQTMPTSPQLSFYSGDLSFKFQK